MNDDYGLQVAAVYLAYFTCRTDAYSVPQPEGWQVAADADGNRLPLTVETILEGLTKKGPSISGYMLAPDNMTHVFAVDFDTEDGQAQAMRLADTLANDKVPAYVALSRRGAHLWVVGMERLPARVIRRALRSWIKESGFGQCPGSGSPAIKHPKSNRPACPSCFGAAARLKVGMRLPDHPDPKIEIRPGQDEVYPDDEGRPGIGTCLRLPFMPHPKTGRSYGMVGVGGEKLGASIGEVLKAIDIAGRDPIEAAAARWVQPIRPEDVPRAYRKRREELPDNLSASQILRQYFGIHNAAPGKAVKCSRHDDKVASLSILRDDQRVICRGGGCELGGPDGRGLGTIQLLKLAGVEVPE